MCDKELSNENTSQEVLQTLESYICVLIQISLVKLAER